MPEIRKGFSPPAEVVEYFARKRLMPAFSWLDVWAEEHAYAFTIAKAVELELLTTFQRSIDGALREGMGFETWKAQIRGELRKGGWYGPRMVLDPDGLDPERVVDFGSSRRLKTIYWSNVNSARAAGQWERAQRTKRALPYLLYVRTTSSDPRQEHLGWVGIILPIDHPFWRTHFPPNGWLCKCQVRQISAREATQLLGRPPADGGIVYRDTVPDLGSDIRFTNRRTGEVTMIPPGIDPGWHTNPGLARAKTLIANLESRIADAPRQAAVRALKDLWSDPFLRLAPQLREKTWLPAGFASSDLEGNLPGAISRIVSVPNNVIADRIAKHQMSVDDFSWLPGLIADGLVLPDPRGDATVRSIVGRFGISVKNDWRGGEVRRVPPRPSRANDFATAQPEYAPCRASLQRRPTNALRRVAWATGARRGRLRFLTAF